jgi:DNA methylase
MSSHPRTKIGMSAFAGVAAPLRHATELSDAWKRWAGVGPYYAMIPIAHVIKQIERFTVPGDTVLDPFCGRGTIPFVASALGRSFFGIEIFPVGWVYSSAKCNPTTAGRVVKRLEEVAKAKPSSVESSEFFRIAYAPRTLSFLCAAREHLDWRNSRIDRTLMALLLVCLHDKKGSGLSNQMRQTKAMHPGYSVRWWRRHRKFTPPDIDPVGVLKAKIEWRYAKGMVTKNPNGEIYLGDCTRVIPRVPRIEKVKLLFTSPPYCGVTNYYVDQWLRNWMLGGPPRPSSGPHSSMKRFDSKEAYRLLLERTFALAAERLRDDAVIIVRTDAREFTLQVTRQVLRKAFPTKRLVTKACPLRNRLSQTALFGDKQEKPGEVDLILH